MRTAAAPNQAPEQTVAVPSEGGQDNARLLSLAGRRCARAQSHPPTLAKKKTLALVKGYWGSLNATKR